MVGKKTIEKMVREGYEARKRGDFDAMAELFAVNGAFRIAGDQKLCQIAKTTKGRAAIRQELSGLAEFKYANHRMLSMAADGETVFMHWRVNVTFKPTGKSATLDIVDLAKMKKGKITSFTQFTDNAAVAELMR